MEMRHFFKNLFSSVQVHSVILLVNANATLILP